MITQTEVIRLLEENLSTLQSVYNVRRIGLFGSIAKNESTENSDVDLLIELQKPMGLKFFNLIDYLEDILGVKVDVITKDGLENIRIKSVQDDIKKNLIYV